VFWEQARRDEAARAVPEQKRIDERAPEATVPAAPRAKAASGR
jgi:hypothetical protein